MTFSTRVNGADENICRPREVSSMMGISHSRAVGYPVKVCIRSATTSLEINKDRLSLVFVAIPLKYSEKCLPIH